MCAAFRTQLPLAPISLATVRGSGGGDDVVRAIDRCGARRDAPRRRARARCPSASTRPPRACSTRA
jgi:hypothetical protein